jgi:hypothetical protein
MFPKFVYIFPNRDDDERILVIFVPYKDPIEKMFIEWGLIRGYLFFSVFGYWLGTRIRPSADERALS